MGPVNIVLLLFRSVKKKLYWHIMSEMAIAQSKEIVCTFFTTSRNKQQKPQNNDANFIESLSLAYSRGL